MKSSKKDEVKKKDVKKDVKMKKDVKKSDMANSQKMCK